MGVMKKECVTASAFGKQWIKRFLGSFSLESSKGIGVSLFILVKMMNYSV